MVYKTTGGICVAFLNKMYRHKKLCRATQFHMLGHKTVYEIRSHFKILLPLSIEFMFPNDDYFLHV